MAPTPFRTASPGDLAALRSKWGWLLAYGILLLIAGILAFLNILLATVVSILFVGVMMLIGGIAQIVHAFQVRGWGQFFLWLLIGALYVIAGLLAFTNPLLASTALTLVFAISVIAVGILRVVAGIALRSHGGWGWMVAGGVLAVIVGLIVLAGWPVNSLWIIGMLLAIDLTFYGAGIIALALALKRGDVPGAAPRAEDT